MTVIFSLYQHFKGGLYFVRGVAVHTETEEEMVVYQEADGERRLFVRPLAMFNETVVVDGKAVPRFAKIPMKVEDAPDLPLTKVSDVRGH